MSKFLLFALFALLAATLISADTQYRAATRATLPPRSYTNTKDYTGAKRFKPAEQQNCGRHGDPCVTVSDCCPVKQMACNRFAKRCQIQITQEELLAQREKILGRKGPDMRK